MSSYIIKDMALDADGVGILRAIIKQRRDEANETSKRIDARQDDIDQSRAELEALCTTIDDLERDADRLEKANSRLLVNIEVVPRTELG